MAEAFRQAQQMAAMVQSGDLAGLAALLDAGADPNASAAGSPGMPATPVLMIAAFSGQAAMAGLLLERGADPNMELPNGLTPALMACAGGSLEALLAIEAAGGNPLKNSKDGVSAVLCAAKSGGSELIRHLAGIGADLDACCPGAGCAVHVAAKQDNAEALGALAGCHADLEALDDMGRTPILVALESQSPAALAVLLNAGADPQRKIEALSGASAMSLCHGKRMAWAKEMMKAAKLRRAESRALDKSVPKAPAGRRPGGKRV